MTTGTLFDTPSLLDAFSDRGTLDELIAAVWEGLGTDRAVACPVCGGEMTPEYGAHARPIGGRCTACGSTLH